MLLKFIDIEYFVCYNNCTKVEFYSEIYKMIKYDRYIAERILRNLKRNGL